MKMFSILVFVISLVLVNCNNLDNRIFANTLFSYLLKLPTQQHQNWSHVLQPVFNISTFYSNFQMAGVIVNSSTHVPISPPSIPQTSNRKVCAVIAQLWHEIFISPVKGCVATCHMPTAWHLLLKGRVEVAPRARRCGPVRWPEVTWSLRGEITSWGK